MRPSSHGNAQGLVCGARDCGRRSGRRFAGAKAVATAIRQRFVSVPTGGSDGRSPRWYLLSASRCRHPDRHTKTRAVAAGCAGPIAGFRGETRCLPLSSPGRPSGKRHVQTTRSIRCSRCCGCGNSPRLAMRVVIHGFGFDSFMYGRLAEPRPAFQQSSFHSRQPPGCSRSTIATPILRMRHADRADAATLRCDGRLRRFLADAALYGIRSGVSVSMRAAGPQPRRAALLGEPSRLLYSTAVWDIMLLATRFHDVLTAVRRPLATGPRGGPSMREGECLQMAAHGLSSVEIGVKLNVASRTVVPFRQHRGQTRRANATKRSRAGSRQA